MVQKLSRLVILATLLLSLILPTAGLAGPPPIDPAIPPEPFPFSNRYPAEIVLDSPDMLALLDDYGVDIGKLEPLDQALPFPHPDEPFQSLVATVYVNDGEVERLERAGLSIQPIPNESLRAFYAYGPGSGSPNAWPTYEDFTTRMQAIATAHPNIVRMVSIGQSVQGRELWALKISDNPDLEENEPEFKYTSTMHGNEAVGTEMTIRLAELLTNNYGSLPTLTQLVDEMEIWLLPLHNPDGYVVGSRYNANGADLNRDYPDRITDPNDNPAGREPETQAMMYWMYDHRFVMGANYHTGALVVNYPWDSVPTTPDYAPDDALFYDFGVGYAHRNPMIWGGGFDHGVTRGWEWYIIRGGMQDWAYHWQGEHHVTIEDSNQQPPPYEQMDSYWDAEREAMLWWMRRPLTGLRGLVSDAGTGDPLDAWVLAEQIGKSVYTDPDVGDYYRMLLAGSYTVTAGAYCYEPQTITVTIVSSSSIVLRNFQLLPASNWTVQGTVTEEGSGRPLSATIEILDTPIVTQSNPIDGQYALHLCEGSYTMRVSAAGYRSEERPIVVDHDQVQNFVLQPTPCTLLVDDDEGENYQSYYQGALNALGQDYDLWTVAGAGSPSAVTLASYGRVIWLTGDDSNSTLTSADQTALSGYLDSGGRLFVSGQDIGYDIGTRPFYADYLHASYLADDTNNYDLDGLDYLSGLTLRIQGGDGANNQDWPSEITPVGGGMAVLDYAGSDLYGGVAYSDSTYGVVYFSFGFEAIDNQADRTEVMSRTLTWLGGCEGQYYQVIAGDSQAIGEAGETVTHTIVLTNIGALSDSYAITLTPGIWPAVLLDSQVGPLGPGQAGYVHVTVDIPLQPLTLSIPLSDVLSLQIASLAAPDVGAQAQATTYTTVDLDLSLELTAAITQQIGLAGQVLTYTLLLSNSGAYSDSYSLELEGNVWPSQVAPTQTGPLGPGQAIELVLRVELPEGAGSPEDTCTVRARSEWDAQTLGEITLLTLHYWGGISAVGSQVAGAPGETVTHTFAISNASSLTDTYVVALTLGDWPAVLLDDSVGPLAPGQAGQVRVRVDIPLQVLSTSLLLSDSLGIHSSSTIVPEIGAQATGDTYAVANLAPDLAAENDRLTARARQIVSYTLVLTNSGDYTDSYALSLAGNTWPSQVAPTQTTPLGPGETAEVQVWVTIPAGPAGEIDTATVRATSSWNTLVYDEFSLVTQRAWGLFLPLLLQVQGGHFMFSSHAPSPD